jgi:hypothetical protein
MAGNFDRFALGGEQHDDGMAKSLRYSANGSGSATADAASKKPRARALDGGEIERRIASVAVGQPGLR